MTIHEFIAKWRKVDLKERSAAQEHFLDLCNVFGHPTPAAADPAGESYCFENPEALRPGRTSAAVTQDAARQFAEIAASMRRVLFLAVPPSAR